MRSYWQTVGIVCFVILLACIADGLYQGLSADKRAFRVLAGGETPVSGDIDLPFDAVAIQEHAEASKGARSLDDYLAFESSSKSVNISFVALSGRLWRGVLQVSETAQPGQETFCVFLKGHPRESGEPVYTAKIFRDSQALQGDLDSMLERHLGVRPWWPVMVVLPLCALCMFQIYRQTERTEERLIGLGIGPIYKLAKRKQSWEVVFGLGSRQGVSEGQRLVILDRNFRPAGHLFAIKVDPDASHATLDVSQSIAPDFMIAREDSAATAVARG